jgi:serine/threonine-protein kinase
MLTPDAALPGGERAKLLDFGIAKVLGDDTRSNVPPTRTGAVIGTPLYMSPEQCRGDKQLDGRSDVYSLGVVMFHMLIGRPPFEAAGEGALIGMHIYEAPSPVRQLAPQVSEPLAALVDAALRKDKTQRPTMQEMADTLTHCSIDLMSSLSRRRLGAVAGPGSMGASPAPTPLADAATRREPGTWIGASSNPSTIGLGKGQLTPPGATKRWLFVISLGMSVLLAAGLAWRLRPKPSAPVRTAETPPPKWVRITIDSNPPGAQVLRLPDSQVLGMTPWHIAQPAAAGLLLLRLRHPAHQDQDLTVALDQDHMQLVTLQPQPTSPSAPVSPQLNCPKGYMANYKAGRCVRKAQNHGRTKLVVD